MSLYELQTSKTKTKLFIKDKVIEISFSIERDIHFKPEYNMKTYL